MCRNARTCHANAQLSQLSGWLVDAVGQPICHCALQFRCGFCPKCAGQAQKCIAGCGQDSAAVCRRDPRPVHCNWLRLRDAIGPIIGANLDPSHLFWMRADPLVAATALGPAMHHGHAKDRLLNCPPHATRSLLVNGSLTDVPTAREAISPLALVMARNGGAAFATGCRWPDVTAGCP